MSADNQKEFMANVRRALGKPIDGGPVPSLFDSPPAEREARLAQYHQRSSENQQALLDELRERAEAVQMGFTVVGDLSGARDVLLDLVARKSPEWGSEKRLVAWDHPLINQLALKESLKAHKVPVFVTRMAEVQDAANACGQMRRHVEAAYMGITGADMVVAHTATLVMRSRPGQLRSVSLVPSIHVCIVTLDQVVSDLEELYTRLQWDPQYQSEGLTNCMTFISAPSKTGDIELVMVNGAHGPREVHLIVVGEPTEDTGSDGVKAGPPTTGG